MQDSTHVRRAPAIQAVLRYNTLRDDHSGPLTMYGRARSIDSRSCLSRCRPRGRASTAFKLVNLIDYASNGAVTADPTAALEATQ